MPIFDPKCALAPQARQALKFAFTAHLNPRRSIFKKWQNPSNYAALRDLRKPKEPFKLRPHKGHLSGSFLAFKRLTRAIAPQVTARGAQVPKSLVISRDSGLGHYRQGQQFLPGYLRHLSYFEVKKWNPLNDFGYGLKGVTKSGMISRKMGFYPITKTEAQKCARLIPMVIFYTVLAAGVPRHVYSIRRGLQRLTER